MTIAQEIEAIENTINVLHVGITGVTNEVRAQAVRNTIAQLEAAAKRLRALPEQRPMTEQIATIRELVGTVSRARDRAVSCGIPAEAADAPFLPLKAIQATLEAQPDVIKALTAASHALKSYATGTNSATDLAVDTAQFVDEVLKKLEPEA